MAAARQTLTAREIISVLRRIPAIVFATDQKGVILTAEGLALEAFGRPEEFAGRSVFAVFRRHPQVPRAARAALAGREQTFRGRFGSRVFEVHFLPRRPQGGMFGAALDVTASELAMQTSQERYRQLYSRTPAMMHSIDRDGRIVNVSDAWLAGLGYRRSEVIGRRSTDFLTPESRRFAREAVLPAFYETGECRDVPYRFVKKSGEIIDVLLSATAERDAEGRVERSLAVLIDVSERRRLENEAVEAAAREQAKLARELHDTLGQTITGISLLAKSLAGTLPDGPAAAKAKQLAGQASAAVEQLRGVARGLLPAELQKANLGGALRDLADAFGELYGVDCAVRAEGDFRLGNQALAVQLYRVAQEAMHNAIKHASPRSIRIGLRVSARRVTLTVRDDGKGLPRRRRSGLGLRIMEQRARSFGGRLSVGPALGGGTLVVCDIPRRE